MPVRRIAVRRPQPAGEDSVIEKHSMSADCLTDRALPMRAFSKSLPMQLLKTREAVMRRFRPGLRRLGVTEQQWRVLRALAHSGEMEAGALARATCLLAPSLSRILPGMEARQLIRRRQVDADLRRTLVSLERRGLRIMSLHAGYAERIYDDISRRLGSERVLQLFNLLQQLESVAALSDAGPERSRTASRNAAAKRSR